MLGASYPTVQKGAQRVEPLSKAALKSVQGAQGASLEPFLLNARPFLSNITYEVGSPCVCVHMGSREWAQAFE
eukprot:1060615-Pelagomonas_calceolata.AAC.2